MNLSPILTTCVIATLLLLPCSRAAADIYQYTDNNGVIHFSNVSVGNNKSYKRIKTEPAAQRDPQTAPRPVVASQTPRSSSSVPGNYSDIIHTACSRHGVDPALVHAIVKVESDFNPTAVSSKGAMGLMQLMPQTAMDLNVSNSFNPYENIDGGVKYLRYLMDRYEGNLSLALAAYNSGETAVKKWGTVPPFRETQNYVQRILKIYNNGGYAFSPRTTTTIYMSYGSDGEILLTDNPGKRQSGDGKRKIPKSL